jgi:hypothetical protein
MVTKFVRKCCICTTSVVSKTRVISILQNVIYHSSKITVPYPTLSPLYLMISFSIQETVALFLCTQTHNNLVWILFWRNMLPPSSESLLETQKSKFLWNTAIQITCYPNLNHIMYIHHCETTHQPSSTHLWSTNRYIWGLTRNTTISVGQSISL